VAFLDVQQEVKFLHLDYELYPIWQLQALRHPLCVFPEISPPLASDIIARNKHEQH
jgi:hypothetical protein